MSSAAVVAVPRCWMDVNEVADLDAAAMRVPPRARAPLPRRHKVRQYRPALLLLARGLADYRIVESLGATEGTPAAGTADLIVDITTTGATLAANGLKVLEDGVILQSEANLVASKTAEWPRRDEKGARTVARAPRYS